MTLLGRAVRNSAVLMASQAITWVASLVLTSALGRHLGAAGFGDLYLAMSFTAIFGLFVEFGLDQQLVRAVARDASVAGSYLSTAIVMKAILASLAYPLMLLTIIGLGYDSGFQHVAAVYGVVMLFVAVSASAAAVYQGSQRMFHAAVGTVIERVLVAAAALALFALGRGVIEIAAAMAASSAVGAFWKARFIGSAVPLVWRPRRETLFLLLRGVPPFLVYAILGNIYYRVDSLLLSKFTDSTVVGWYGAAYRLFDTMVFLPGIVSAAVMFPILATLSLGSRDGLRSALSRGIQTISLIGVPIAVGLYLVADQVIRLVYGASGFGPAAEALRWLMPGLLLLYLNSILTVALVSINRERRLTVLAALSCVINIGLNLALIPVFQHVAAAAVTSATELFIFGYLLLNVPRDVLDVRAFATTAKAGGAAAAMAAVVISLRDWPLPVVVSAGAITYGFAGFALKILAPADLRRLRAAVVGRTALPAPSES